MPFQSEAQKKKCKYCDKDAKINYWGIKRRHKGYYRTCGSEVCLNRQYKDKRVSATKAYVNKKEMTVCLSCNNEFVKEHFNHKWCKTCVPDKKARSVMQRYGISKPMWDKMYLEQKGRCAICDEEAKVIDHNHKTGEVRGLLCYGCNLLVGLIERDKTWITKAVGYIQ